MQAPCKRARLIREWAGNRTCSHRALLERCDFKNMCCILAGHQIEASLPRITSKQAIQASLLSVYIYVYIYIYIFIYIYINIYIDIRRVVLTHQVSQACLPSKSAKQVFHVYIYIYTYLYIYIPVFQQVFQAISTIPQPWSSSVTITRPNRNNQIRTTRTY